MTPADTIPGTARRFADVLPAALPAARGQRPLECVPAAPSLGTDKEGV
jgi:hypothetical protein